MSALFNNKTIKTFKLNSFKELISYSSLHDSDFSHFVDGGAGLGETANEMIDSCRGSIKKVLAFEPNPANVSAFINNHPDKVILVPAALGAKSCTEFFEIPETTKKTTANTYHVEGTSFVGKLSSGQPKNKNTAITVPVVRLVDKLNEFNSDKIDFLKLDLQGGELNSLIGLDYMLKKTKLIWMEYTGQPGLLSFIQDSGFTVFDTEYLFVGEPNNLIEEFFYINRSGRNSIGKNIFFGQRRHVWKFYEKTFDLMKRRRRLIQTDLVVVNNLYLEKIKEFTVKYKLVFDGKLPDLLTKINNQA